MSHETNDKGQQFRYFEIFHQNDLLFTLSDSDYVHEPSSKFPKYQQFSTNLSAEFEETVCR